MPNSQPKVYESITESGMFMIKIQSSQENQSRWELKIGVSPKA